MNNRQIKYVLNGWIYPLLISIAFLLISVIWNKLMTEVIIPEFIIGLISCCLFFIFRESFLNILKIKGELFIGKYGITKILTHEEEDILKDSLCEYRTNLIKDYQSNNHNSKVLYNLIEQVELINKKLHG